MAKPKLTNEQMARFQLYQMALMNALHGKAEPGMGEEGAAALVHSAACIARSSVGYLEDEWTRLGSES